MCLAENQMIKPDVQLCSYTADFVLKNVVLRDLFAGNIYIIY